MAVSSRASFGSVLAEPPARAVVERYLPGFADSPTGRRVHGFPIEVIVASSPLLAETPGAAAALLAELGALDDVHLRPVTTDRSPSPSPAAEVEDAGVPRASARVTVSGSAIVWRPVDVVLDGPRHGNPFVDVELSAVVEGDGRALRVGGFYDGDGRYVLRFMPTAPGTWTFTTSSNARSLDGVVGEVETVVGNADHGPVEVRGGGFGYRGGGRYLPIGTTAYAWTHQEEELEEQTLATLAASPFAKLRMCVLPKSYLYNANEPPRYPFEHAGDGWDLERPVPEFFRHLERRVTRLDALGVEADLIAFHPYDRWGFSSMPAAADDRYLRYLVRRLAAFRNVWWSLANEYDLMFAKEEQDWERFAAIVREEDPYGHLLSIHNWRAFYDHARHWVTHASIQRVDPYTTAELTDEWRRRWGKPVVVDECGYEGDIDLGWGNLTGEEMVRRCWEGAVRGGYVGHGETYHSDDEVLWWSKGGVLKGSSPTRIAFLRQVLADAPEGIRLLSAEHGAPCGGVPGEYYLTYFGMHRPRFRNVLTHPDVSYRVDVLDTWNMTVTELDGERSGAFRVELPGRPYMAVRMRAVRRA